MRYLYVDVRATCLAFIVACFVATGTAGAAEWFVAPGGTGGGSSTAPFGRIQDALTAALPGDVVTVRGGTYNEAIQTVRHGSAAAPIRVRALGERGSVIVTARGRVLTVNHAYFVVDGLVLDGMYGTDDTIRVATAATAFMLRNAEVRRSSHDLIDMAGPQGVVIEHCLIHRALNASGGRTDAHGIAAGPVRNLVIRNTEIHTFSGDGVQVDPGRSAPGWTQVTLDSVRIWLAPLAKPENGFAAGVVAGENAVDTKASASLPRATLTLRNVTAYGFRNGLITNMAAFNLKEHVSATVEGATVYDSEIAFRLRGAGGATTGAWVTIRNAVVHDVGTAYRYEDSIQNLRIWNNTVGLGVTRPFRAAASTSSGVEVRNLLIVGALPAEAAHASNLAVAASAVANAAAHDYRLAAGAVAIDRGIPLAGVTTDRAGTARPQGAAPDVGAYEWQPARPGESVTHVGTTATNIGRWVRVTDSTAASGVRLTHADSGAAAVSAPRAVPLDYFEATVWAESGRPYRVWLRGRAQSDAPANDSVYVQFSSSVTASGAAAYRIGTTSALAITLEDCPGCGLAGWGWQDTASGVELLGPTVLFAQTGWQTVRVQTREDGVSIDQLVLSTGPYLGAAPGTVKDDRLILPASY